MTIPNVVGNIAGNAQAQRFAVSNFNREQAAANANYAKQLRDKILTGLFDTGISTAIGFGEKAYDEAHGGARQQQTIDNAKAVDDFNVRAKKLEMGIDMPGYKDAAKAPVDTFGASGYGPEQETASDRSPLASAAASALAKARESAPETGYGRMGRMGIEGGTSAADGPPVSRDAIPKPAPVNFGAGQRDMGAPTQPVLAQRPRTEAEALSSMPEGDDRTFQARLIEMKKQAAEAMAAKAEAARQKREDTIAKEAEANRLKSYQLIGGLQTATEQKLGARGRPVNVPQFGVRPTIDPETGIVRPEFTDQPSVQMPSTGGGAAKPTFSGVLGKTVVIIAAREGRKGDPTTGTPTKTWASLGDWATRVVSDKISSAKYAVDPPDKSLVAQALRIIKANEADPTKADVVAKAVKTLDDIREKAIRTTGPVFAETGDVMGTSPTDAAKAVKADQTAAEKAAQQAADRQAAIDAQLQDVRSKAADLERDYSRDVDSALEKTFKRRGSRGGLSTQQLRDAADGDPPPDGLDAEAAAAWSQAAQATQAARVYRARMIESLKAKAAAISGRKQGTPGGQ